MPRGVLRRVVRRWRCKGVGKGKEWREREREREELGGGSEMVVHGMVR